MSTLFPSRRGPASNSQRGAVLAIVICLLVVFGMVGGSLLTLSASRRAQVLTFEARLELERIRRAAADYAASRALGAYTTGAGAYAVPTFAFPTSIWSIESSNADTFPADILTALRGARPTGNGNPGAPASLLWYTPYSEPLFNSMTVNVRRASMGTTDDTALVVAAQVSAWCIPAGSVPFLCSSTPLSVESSLAISVNGSAVFVNGDAPGSLSATRTFVNGKNAAVTAGPQPELAVTNIYRNAAMAGFSEVNISSADSLPPGFVKGLLDGTPVVILDLNTYDGEPNLFIRGVATSAGVVVMGASTASGSPLALSSDAPLFLAGNNYRYVSIATTAQTVAICTAPTYSETDAAWIMPPPGLSTGGTQWTGHLFIAHADPTLHIRENWSGSWRVQGSLHLLGGVLSTSGPGRATFSHISVGHADLSAFNPFSESLAHESFLAVKL